MPGDGIVAGGAQYAPKLSRCSGLLSGLHMALPIYRASEYHILALRHFRRVPIQASTDGARGMATGRVLVLPICVLAYVLCCTRSSLESGLQ